ncbi:MAG: hypothetical protein ACRD0H_00225 [Actinomycetes bacterium]
MAHGDLSAGDLLAQEFARWTAEARAAEAAEANRRARWLGQQAGEGATLAGTLLDLAEREAPVVATTGARAFGGAIVGVGRDFCVLAEARRTALVRLAAITSVQPSSRQTASLQGKGTGEPRASMAEIAAGARVPPLDAAFRDALEVLVADRSPVRLVLVGGVQVSGALVGLGADVASVRADEPPRAVTYVALEAVVACWPM